MPSQRAEPGRVLSAARHCLGHPGLLETHPDARGAGRAVPVAVFVPIRVVGGAQPPAAAIVDAAPAASSEIEIVLAHGRRVRARGQVDPQWLGQVVRMLEALGC